MLALLTIPIPLGIALVATDLVPLFLGAQWQPTVAILQPLCVAAAITGIGTNSRLAYLALDRSHLPAIAAALRVVLLLALLAIVAPSHGVVGVAYAVAGVSSALVVVDYLLSSRLLGIDVRRFLAVVWRPVTASIAMCAAVMLLRAGFAPASDLPGHAWSLARSAMLGTLVYVACVLGLWIVAGRRDGAERRILFSDGKRPPALVRRADAEPPGNDGKPYDIPAQRRGQLRRGVVDGIEAQVGQLTAHVRQEQDLSQIARQPRERFRRRPRRRGHAERRIDRDLLETHIAQCRQLGRHRKSPASERAEQSKSARLDVRIDEGEIREDDVDLPG